MHKRIYGLIGWINDVNQSLMSFQPKMLTRILVNKRRFVDYKHFGPRRQWNRPMIEAPVRIAVSTSF